ncbi:hypothetical protein CDL15_Pgr017096 [Punica granatum]|uniref:Bet v I/Major latex protein domain-containing protein n=1 Tax=Punica granatum TaxID=22663 RepID=A0A218VZA6_PUNGR|nr:hypothetical protein CDL15_Pgr017096 [Punica granatum]
MITHGSLISSIRRSLLEGVSALTSYKEKYTKVDNENRVKEAEVIEGGFLDLGFTLYLVRFQVFEKGQSSCSVKSTIEYELPDELAASASLVSIEPFVMVLDLAKEHLLSLHGNNKAGPVS